jgi:hypothetical protein
LNIDAAIASSIRIFYGGFNSLLYLLENTPADMMLGNKND